MCRERNTGCCQVLSSENSCRRCSTSFQFRHDSLNGHLTGNLQGFSLVLWKISCQNIGWQKYLLGWFPRQIKISYITTQMLCAENHLPGGESSGVTPESVYVFPELCTRTFCDKHWFNNIRQQYFSRAPFRMLGFGISLDRQGVRGKVLFFRDGGCPLVGGAASEKVRPPQKR